MMHFILEVHKAFKPPQIRKWVGFLDPKSLRENEYALPEDKLFQIVEDKETLFTDMITHPCFMVSEKVMETIKLYEPSLDFTRIVLTEEKIETIGIYYIPRLEELDVITSMGRVGRDKSTMDHFELDGEKIKDKTIFQIEHNEEIYVIAHLELVESLLRREALGIGLREVDIKGGRGECVFNMSI